MSKAAARFAPPLGAPPSIEFKAVAELQVDHSYQRDLADDSKRAIRAIADSFDWRLCAPLTVSRRVEPAGFFVIDGQHRLEAAKLRGDIPFLPCIVSTFLSIEDEARCFINVNTRRRKVTPLETFRAELAAGDEKAIQIDRIIREAGLKVARHTNWAAWKAREISAISGVRGAIFRHGEAITLAALQDLAAAFPDAPMRYAGTILIGLYAIHAGKEPVDRPSLVAALRSRDQEAWNRAVLQRQAKFGELRETAIAEAIREACEEERKAA